MVFREAHHVRIILRLKDHAVQTTILWMRKIVSREVHWFTQSHSACLWSKPWLCFPRHTTLYFSHSILSSDILKYWVLICCIDIRNCTYQCAILYFVWNKPKSLALAQYGQGRHEKHLGWVATLSLWKVIWLHEKRIQF